MQNIRRLYFYAISLISLEVVLWGSIGLLRSVFSGQEIGSGGVDRLAGALALILVGIPVFLLHWRWIRRDVQNEPDARSARVRAIFLYVVLLATLAPVVQNALSFLEHLFLQLFDVNPLRAALGGNQSWSDNLIAILVNLIAAGYFYRILLGDWRSGENMDAFSETRRLYRYLWLFYGLAMVVAGIQQLVQFIFLNWNAVGDTVQVILANGLAFLLAGIPIWLYTDRLIRRSLAQPSEKESLTRLIALYLLVFISLIGCLAALGGVLYQIFQVLLGAPFVLSGFLAQIAGSISIVISLGLIWLYYGRDLRVELRAIPHSQPEPSAIPANDTIAGAEVVGAERERQRRAELRRLYYYLLAFLGLLAMFVGLQLVLSGVLDLAFSAKTFGIAALRNQLASGIAALVIGMPVWLMTWRPMALEAAQEGESADYARRSPTRKAYLYLLLFGGVLGVMFTAGMLIYQLLRALLGDPVDNILLAALQQFKSLLLFAGLLIFHGLALRADNRIAERSLARRYAQFPVLILALDESDFDAYLAKAIQDLTPGLPVAIHHSSLGAPDAELSTARAVILPAELVSRPSEALRLWLQGFSGERLVITLPTQGWYWVPVARKGLAGLARQTAQIVRQLAEGQEAPPLREYTAFMVGVYIFAGLFALELVLAAISLVASLIFQ
jgi:hypothetical protein